MKLSKLYASKPDVFPPILFRGGLNVVLAQIRAHGDRSVDTHNLGKTTLAALIDYCLLKKKSSSFFLFKHAEQFGDFAFFLELQTNAGSYLTLRRAVGTATRISFKKHDDAEGDFTHLDPDGWDHSDVAFDRAKELLDGLLDLRAASPWRFRQPLGYCLRLQDDYSDVFQLDKHRGSHSTWKPFLAHMLGLDGEVVSQTYDVSNKIAKKADEEEALAKELAGVSDAPDKLEGIILVRKQEVEKLEEQLSNYDFAIPEEQFNKNLVDQIERETAELNDRRYYLSLGKSRIEENLDQPVKFDLKRTEQVWKEAGIYFPDQLSKDYGALLGFLKAISGEREEYLREELLEIDTELKVISERLPALSKERSRELSVLREVETFEKYKKLNGKLVELKATLETLARQKEALKRLQALRKELRGLRSQKEELRAKLEENLEAPGDLYQRTRLFFSEIVKAVLDRNGVLSTKINKEGNLVFSADILDETGTTTSQDDGHTYKKLLCIAFDMAVLRSHVEDEYVRFVYHDGVFESLDDRKKLNLLAQMREYESYGLQQIITLIDTDLPREPDGTPVSFASEEIVRTLHDKGPSGRLFRTAEW